MFAINEAFGEVAARVDYILPNLIERVQQKKIIIWLYIFVLPREKHQTAQLSVGPFN